MSPVESGSVPALTRVPWSSAVAPRLVVPEPATAKSVVGSQLGARVRSATPVGRTRLIAVVSKAGISVEVKVAVWTLVTPPMPPTVKVVVKVKASPDRTVPRFHCTQGRALRQAVAGWSTPPSLALTKL